MILGWAILVFGYFLGSVPFGHLFAKAKGVDILNVGSGNIGATNVGRALGKKAAATVFALDVAKGFVPALLGQLLLENGAFYGLLAKEVGLLAGALAVLGHMASPFLKFRGGKGVATGLGAMIGANPLVAFVALGAFIVVVAFTRIVSLGAIVSMPFMMVFGFWVEPSWIFRAMFVILGGLILYRHRSNMARLVKGEEPKFSFARTSSSDEPAA